MSMLSNILRNPLVNTISGGFTGRIADAATAVMSPFQGGGPGPGQITIGGGVQLPIGGGVSGGITFPSPFGGGGRPMQPQGAAPSGGTCPRGYHLNKHALAASRRHGALPARSTCVRNRSINPLNHRALTRALRREKRARKLLGKLHIVRSVARAASGRSGHKAGCGCFACRKR